MTAPIATHGTSGNDTINGITSGASTDNILYGHEGNDTLSGGGTDDVLYGGAGDDYLSAGNGNDLYYYDSGADLIVESGGTDVLEIDDTWSLGDLSLNRYMGVAPNNLVIEFGGSNSVTIQNFYSSSGYEIETLRLNDGNGDISFDNLTVTTHGTSGADTIYADYYAGTNAVFGYADNDYLHGGVGADSIYGGDGDDTLYGYSGNDAFYYSAGLDVIHETGGADALHVMGGSTINDVSVADYDSYHTKVTLNGGADEATIMWHRLGSSNEVETIRFDDGFSANLLIYNSWLKGTSGNDTIGGNSNDNVLIGYSGDDTINAGTGSDNAHGGAGADTMHGDGGGDLLHGGAGDDVVYGDDGLDTLYGGSGADTFMLEATEAFNNVDVIKDFNVANDNDVLDISDILDATGYNHGVDPITDWVEITTSGSDSIVKIDRDGTAGTYSMAQVATLEGITGLTDEAALATSGNLIAA